jgi:RHS repeat-associated protein
MIRIVNSHSTNPVRRLTKVRYARMRPLAHSGRKRLSALVAAALILTLLQSGFVPFALAAKHEQPQRRVAAGRADVRPFRTQDLSLQSEAVEAAVVRHAPIINALVQGSVRQLTGENVALNGTGAITVALLVPGTPTVTLNGNPTFGGTVQGTGSAQPSGYHVTLNGGASLGKLVTRTDPIAMPAVTAPPVSTGTRDVSLNHPADSPGDFGTVRDLTINGTHGPVAVPPGTYRTYTANSGNTFVFGIAGSSQPAVYNLSRLTLNSGSRLQVVGPVLLTIATDVTLNGSAGVTANPLWLQVNIASGGLTLNSGSTLYGVVRAPSGIVTLNGNSLLHGSVFSDRLTLNSNSVLEGEPGVLDSITPNRASDGQAVSVTLRGINTHWVQGQTRASFGGEISVGGAAEGDFGTINVIDSTTATAQISASATAALAPRTVQIQTPIVGQTQVQQENLPNAFTIVAASPPGSPASTVTTMAGGAGLPGFADGPASAARFRDPAGIAIGADGSIYVADAGNNRIRVVRASDGSVSTLAGDGTAGFADGPGGSAKFNGPRAVAVDASGVVYVADTGNNRIRRIASDGSVTTLAGDGTAGLVNGAGAQARFSAPGGLVLDNQGDIYVADTGNASVRFISINGIVSTVAGDGTIGNGDSPNARFDGLIGVTFDGTRAYAYVADTNNHRLRRLDPNGNVITIAGSSRGFADGSGAQARFADPSGIAVEASTKLVIADTTNSLVRNVDPNLAAAPVVTIAGTGERGLVNGSGNQARFFTPRGIAVAQSSAIIVADSGNHVLRKVLVPPVINSLAPNRSRAGATVMIDGERFDGRSPDRNTVSFTKAGGGQTQAQVISATRAALNVLVPEDAATGRVTVRTEGGTATSSADFEFVPRPVIIDFNPKSGAIASIITITGTGLKSTQGETVVSFAGAGGSRVNAINASSSPIEVRAIVPSGAVTGPITLQTEGGSATTAAIFQVLVATPSITAFNPTSGEVGSTVTLTGVNLKAETGPTSVTFAGSGSNRIQALLTFVSTNEVHVIVPNGAVTGVIQLTNALGQAVSPAPFTVTPGQNDYQLTVAPSSTTAVQAGTATLVLFLTSPSTTFSQLVSLTATGLPQGASAQFNPQQITAGALSTLSVRLSGTNPGPGSYSFTIRGSGLVNGTELVRTANASLTVLAAGQTTLSGRVLSTEDEPIMGATVSVDGKTATTDAAGAFLLSGVTAGIDRPLMVDGRTASAPNRTYPLIIEPATIVAGQANVVPYTFYLPAIDTQFEVDVVPGQTTVATNPRVPGLQMTIPPEAHLRNRDGSPVARVSITPLAIDRTPAPLPGDVGTNLVYTSQPGAAISDVPMPVVYPNLAGADPGARIELYAFNHDTVQWYVYGFGRVSTDGRRIEPEINPQTGRPYGLPDFSWHFPDATPQGNPSPPDSCPVPRTPNTVDLATGVKIEEMTDLSFGGARGGIALTRVYTSELARNCDTCPFGRGWTHNYAIKLTGPFQQGGAGRVVLPEQVNGRLFGYTRTDQDGALVFSTTATTGQLGDVVRKLANGTFEYRYADGGLMRFDSTGRLGSIVDRNSNTTELTYTGQNLTRITDSVGRSLVLDYDSSNRITRVTDPIGRSWGYTYEGTPGVPGPNGLTTVTDPLGNIMRYDYVNGGRLSKVTDKRGIVAKQINYDTNGRVIEQRFADGGIEEYSYVLAGRVVTFATKTDALLRATSMRFNASGYVIAATDALGQNSRTERDLTNNLAASVTGPCGCAEVRREFDERGNVTASTDRLGQTERVEYEPVFNNVTKITDKLGRVTRFGYDSRGNLTLITDALNQLITFTYDQFGEMTSVKDPLGQTSHMEYDTQGDLKATIDALGNRTTFDYDGIGRVTASVDPLGRRSVLLYDALNRVTASTNSAQATTRFGYDQNGNQTSITDALGRQWTTSYDVKNRPVSATDPIGRVARGEYDTEDEPIAKIAPSGRTVRYSFDGRGQVISLTDPLGGVTQFTYDNRGNLSSVTDQRGNITTFSYDELFRPIGGRDPLGRASTIGYNANDNVVETIDRLGRRVMFDYDLLDRLTRASYVDAVVNYIYDAASRLMRIDDTQGGSVSWVFDDANRLLSETTPGGVVNYTYNSASQIVSMTAADRQPVTYGYDLAGRLQTITQGAESFTYEYDTLSRRTSLQRPNGVTTSYSYDEVARLVRLLHSKTGSAPIEDFHYAYNVDDEIASVASLASASVLPAAKTASAADGANRIEQFGAANYGFDLEGQTTSRTDVQGLTGYQWDARGRMARATLPSGQVVSYGYDALGRRSSRAAGGVTTSFLYDGDAVVLDRGNDSSTVDYLNGIGIDEELRQSTSAGPLYFVRDHLGSTAALLDASGTARERAQYEPFGESTGSTFTRYGYTGRERDSATGLIYYRARWFDPSKGRFLTEDPTGFLGGANLYTYVHNAPVNHIDPLGLYEIDVHFYLTYFLAMKTGCFSDKQARLIAESDQYIDENPETSPEFGRQLPNLFKANPSGQEKNARYHALHPGSHQPYLDSLWGDATKGDMFTNAGRKANLKGLGTYLHYLQDMFSHNGYTSSTCGHGCETQHYPDKTANDVEKAMLMAQTTWTMLNGWATQMKCDCSRRNEGDQSWWDDVRLFAEAPGGRRLAEIGPSALETKRRLLGVPKR